MDSSNKIGSPKINKPDNKEIKYPFNGTAPNLIDKFLVLGYDEKTIDFTYQNYNIESENNLSSYFTVFQFDERPNIVNEICNDYSKDLLDNDLIAKLIFPNYPQMYFLKKNILNKSKEIDEEKKKNPYSIIFSINLRDNNGSYKSYNGLGYIFYELQEHKVDENLDGYLYVPIAYVILSEFPYFSHFNKICQNIYHQIKKDTSEIPIDIIIYNIIKFIPSPINKSIILLYKDDINIQQNNNINIENILFNLNSFKNIIFYSSNPEYLNMFLYLFNCFNYPFNDSIYYQCLFSISKDLLISETSIFFDNNYSTMIGVLSKYDPEILSNKIIKDHFVLDIDNKNFFFFYQEENEKVEETLYLFTYIKSCIENLNYYSTRNTINDDFQDEINLYECIKNLMEKLMKRSKKVNFKDYNSKYCKFRPSFYDRYEFENEMECIESNKNIQEAFYIFIFGIMQYFEFNIENDYMKDINNYEIITNYLQIINDFENISNSRIPSFIKEYDIPPKESQKLNGKKSIEAKIAGKIFKEQLLNTSKLYSFAFRNNKNNNLYKIPYTFFKEFIYYSQFKFINEINFFNLIDQFYGKIKLLDFVELTNKKGKDIELEKEIEIKDLKAYIKKEKKEKKKIKTMEIELREKRLLEEKELRVLKLNNEKIDYQIYLFSFDNFSEFYHKNLRAIINREQEDDKENFFKVKSNNKFYKSYRRNNYFLSQKILNIYITFTNNNLKELLKIFELVKFDNKNLKKDEKETSQININFCISNNAYLIGKSKFINSLADSEKKNEEIDYFYLLQNKHNNDKSLKEKVFSTYNILEISEVIEKNLILQR